MPLELSFGGWGTPFLEAPRAVLSEPIRLDSLPPAFSRGISPSSWPGNLVLVLRGAAGGPFEGKPWFALMHA